MDTCERIDTEAIDAVLFDLDGVVTDTASLHAAAWKKMFDDFLVEQSTRDGKDHDAFDMQKDYLRYVDGKPRYDGVVSFLQSRGIELPFGDPGDAPGELTVCGLGNRKNQIYNELIDQKGIKVYEGSVRFIHKLRNAGTRTAMVTSSKNGRKIIAAAGIEDLFDVVVDGTDAEREKLTGKPAPDIFLNAAAKLGTKPDRAVVVEDAESGVEAGRRGRFACVIGVNRGDNAEQLRLNGAHVVVSDLGRVEVSGCPDDGRHLPSALECFEQIEQATGRRGLVVFLDYDGTLTPIVDRPEDADLADDTKEWIQQLARQCPVAIVSGRDLKDVRQRVGLPDIYYAGSHGFDIAGPENETMGEGLGDRFIPRLDQAEERLHQKLAGIEGSRLERKKYALAVHYRLVAEDRIAEVEQAVREALAQTGGLRLSGGKKVFELRPDVDWDKGKAVRWLLTEALGLETDAVLPIYIGDDVTDEDAFKELHDDGIGILVDGEGYRQDSAAHFRLKDPNEVRHFLQRLSLIAEAQASRLSWRLTYEGFDPEKEALREALTTLGNGYFCTRGALSQSRENGVHYPGTYLAGGYNRLKSEVRGHIIENEDLVNLPNWLPLNFRFSGGPWFDISAVDLLDYRHELDIHGGVLHRSWRFKDRQGRITAVRERRLVHMGLPHLAALELYVTAENWFGSIEFRSAIDGRVVNNGVKRYRGLNNQHLQPVETAQVNDETIFLKARTTQSEIEIAIAARTRLCRKRSVVPDRRRTFRQSDYISQLCQTQIHQGDTLRVEKVVSLYTSRDAAISESGLEARQAVHRAGDFAHLLERHGQAWHHLWRRFGLEIALHDQEQEAEQIIMVVNLYLFHVLQTVSINDMRMGLDAGVPSRGWHGEAYRGHIFWDELFIFPLINLRLPEITKSLLMYRYRRLPAARRLAQQAGFKGAMYPWQSGSDGREESQQLHLNPRSRRWLPDNSRLQRHVNIAIAYNLYNYYQVTHDREFLAFYGAEMILDIARFLSSLAQYNADLDRYEIFNVMGPDEYHDGYPGATEPGLNNNAYTNVMTVWTLQAARELLDELPQDVRVEVCDRLKLQKEEFERWEDICRKMRVVFHDDGIISQFEGYADLEEFDWEAYRKKYGDIQRLDRILEAENDTPNRYKASKQADVLMLFYLLSAEELQEIFSHLGYRFTYETIPKNIDYYLKRTSHGSTLSSVVHAWVLARRDRPRSWELFGTALQSDVSDIQGGTTPEGIHLGAMAGVVDQLQRGYTGIVTRGNVLWFNPRLPDDLKHLKMRIRYRYHFLEIDLTHERLRVTSLRTSKMPIQIGFLEKVYELSAESTRFFRYAG